MYCCAVHAFLAHIHTCMYIVRSYEYYHKGKIGKNIGKVDYDVFEKLGKKKFGE